MILFFLLTSFSMASRDAPTGEPPAPDATTYHPTIPQRASTDSNANTQNPPLVPSNSIGSDTNCTINKQGSLVYSERATGCYNVWDDSKCKLIFGDNKSDGAQAGENNTRPVKCYQDATGSFDYVSNSMAIQKCARYCGYCCEKEEFNCLNNPEPAVNCSMIKKEQCFDINMRELLIQNCPNVCGFCSLNGCVDLEDICVQQRTICDTDKVFSATNCRRTCNLCTPYAPSQTTNTPGSCKDRYQYCSDWNKYNQYCDSYHYTYDDKKRDCAATCGLC